MDNLELLRRLLAHIDEQADTILSLQEYVVALRRSHGMLAASRKLELPPPA